MLYTSKDAYKQNLVVLSFWAQRNYLIILVVLGDCSNDGR